MPSTVVGVVGIGHVAGIKEHWGKVKEEDIPPLLLYVKFGDILNSIIIKLIGHFKYLLS